MEIYTKEELKNWFGKMKGIEHYACDFYEKIANDPEIKNKEVKEAFRKISEDEKEHEKMVDKILNIIENSL